MTIYQKTLDDKIVGAVGTSAPSGFTSVANFATLVTNARTANLPLFLRAGTYPSLSIDVLTSNGGGNPLYITAAAKTAVIQLSGTAGYLLQVSGVQNVVLENVVLDGANVALTGTDGLVQFFNGAHGFEIRDCAIKNSTRAAISVYLSNGTVSRNTITNVDVGIKSLNGVVTVEDNILDTCFNNGILIWTSTVTGNGSRVTGNQIRNINNASGGTGEYGNGISVYRAGNVKVSENFISATQYSSIRFNAAGNGHIVNNYCYSARETAIYAEAPSAGQNLDGGVIAGNIVNGASNGISVVNQGQFGDGISRRVTVVGNQIVNITVHNIPEEGGNTGGSGIIVEGSVNVVGNSIENCQQQGIQLGTNSLATELIANGNFIHSCATGIGYSGSGTGTIVTGNMISAYIASSNPSDTAYPYSGAIVSTSYNGSVYQRDSSGGVANTDYGNTTTPVVVGNLTVGPNRAHV